MHRNENSANSFSYAINGKYLEELPTPALNGINVGFGMRLLRQLFSTLGWPIGCVACITTNKTIKKRKTVTTFSEMEHRHDEPVASFECACVNKSIIYVTIHKQKTPINMLSRSKALNTANFGLQAYKRNQWIFLLHLTSVYFSTHNRSSNIGYFAKVSITVKS